MALKTFNINEEIYKKFSEHCKSQGLSMSKKIENFIKQEMEKMSIKSLFPQTESTNPMQAHRLREVPRSTEQQEHSFKKYC